MAGRRKLKPEKWAACVADIAAKGKINKGEALKLLEEVANRGEKMRLTGQADPFVSAAKDLVTNLKAAADRRALDALRNAGVRKKILDDIKAAGGLSKAADIIRSNLHGTNVQHRDSVQARTRGMAAEMQAPVDRAIEKAGLKEAARLGALDNDTADDMWAMKAGPPKGPANNPARKLAEILAPPLSLLRKRFNMAGAHIGDVLDHVAHTNYDGRKMRIAAGRSKTPDEAFDAWWRVTEGRWNPETFTDNHVEPEGNETMGDARRRFARSVFDAVVTGVHKQGPGLEYSTEGFVPLAYEGSANLARKLSEPRVIRWKSGRAWMENMREFGMATTLTQAVMQEIETGARHIALMEKFGTNPMGNLKLIMRQVEEDYRSDLDGVKKFQDKKNGIEAVMMQLDGSANRPANQMGAAISSSIRTVLTMGFGGGFGLTHLASVAPTVTSELRHHGVPMLKSLGLLIQKLAGGRYWTSEERKDIQAKLGAYAAGLTREMYSRWQPDVDGIPGRLAGLANIYMKFTVLPYIFENTQAGVREVLANDLARYSAKRFGELDPHLSQIIGKYGIGEAEWDLLRAVPDLPQADGMTYLTPDVGRRIDPVEAEKLLRARGTLGPKSSPETIAREVEHLGFELSDKLASYYGDTAALSVVTPGAKERAWVLGKTQRGTVPGEAARFMLQFKMWPIAAMTQLIGREIHLSLNKKDMAWGLGTLAAISTLAGYVRLSVNNAASGRPVPDPMDPRTLLASLAQGGGVGILGDFLFGEVNRFEGGLWSTLAGPLATEANSVWTLYQRWANGDYDKDEHPTSRGPWADLLRLGVRHVPGANLVYLKGFLDYLVWYHLYEAASPGWWERTNRRLIREQGRGMAGYRPGGGVPGPIEAFKDEFGIGQQAPPSPPRGAVEQPTIQ
jgi:hypothetical protein